MGLELLVRSEQRVATLQRGTTDLIEKQIQVKARLTQIEIDLRPQSIDRATNFEGAGVQAVEVRENRRDRLVGEQRSLMLLIQQLERSITEADASVCDAHCFRLSRKK
jgi:hypothetical protein